MTSLFYIIEGEKFLVEATDVVVVPPGKKFYYTGELKWICVTAPVREEEFEESVRNIDLQ